MASDAFTPDPGQKLRSEGDIKWYTNHGVPENDRLEFKREMYASTDDGKRAMLKDITAFANHRGGRIIIGIEEDDEGCASRLVGIDPSPKEPYDQWIRAVCLSNVDERIRGLDIYQVPISGDKVVVVIDIPESPAAPHMITFRGLNQFWRRYGRQNQAMSVEEIRDVILRSVDRANRIQNWMSRRRQVMRHSLGPMSFIVVGVLPYYFRGDAFIDVVQMYKSEFLKYDPITYSGGFITVDSVRAEEFTSSESQKRQLVEYLELFDNGYLEYGKLVKELGEGPTIEGEVFADDTVYLSRFLQGRYAQYVSDGPILVKICIYRAGTVELISRRPMAGAVELISRRPMTERRRLSKAPLDDCVECRDIVVDSLRQDGSMLPKQICDRLWNAFGCERSPYFNDNGELLGEDGRVRREPWQ